jgi:hypothetical protein
MPKVNLSYEIQTRQLPVELFHSLVMIIYDKRVCEIRCKLEE